METISRRQFLYVSGLLSISYPLSFTMAFSREDRPGKDHRFPTTIAVLKAACVSEMTAHQHYDGYSRKALDERYPNIAYLFSTFSVSEKIHADNYERILTLLDAGLEKPEPELLVSGTKANLRKAAKNELIKIQKTYPDYLAKLEKESYDEAVINCMYSWKSHKQHEEKIREILKYSKFFVGSVAKEIEGMKLDFHVCEMCGSTIDEPPTIPCDICNYPLSHYQKVKRPT